MKFNFTNIPWFLVSLVIADSPLNDGFGVVIVTICMQQTGNILLQSNESSRVWTFGAPEGSMYVLAGPARCCFDHGVLCPLQARRREHSMKLHDVSPQPPLLTGKKKKKRGGQPKRLGRESLNLRFAVHGNVPTKAFFVGDEMPLFYSS